MKHLIRFNESLNPGVLVCDVKQETDIMIIGSVCYDDSDVRLYDDYTFCTVMVGGNKEFSFHTDGFLTILTLEEFEKWLPNNKWFTQPPYDIECAYLPFFKGKISMKVELSSNEYSSDFKLNNFIADQIGIDNIDDFIIDLPRGTTAYLVEDPTLFLPLNGRI